MKTQHTVPLTGCINGQPAKTQQAELVDTFLGRGGYFRVTPYEDMSAVILETSKGRYDLPFNNAAGIYQGVANGAKVHVTLKKISGKLIYWA